MATDERNFRSSYYEKVGFRSVEEKKSLEILLKDRPVGLSKLKQFCLRFTVPPVYRTMLWKLMFHITPLHPKNNDIVWRQRNETYDELTRSLKVMQLLQPGMKKPAALVVLWLLESGQLKYDMKIQLDDHLYKGFILISKTILGIADNDVDAYWMARGFYQLVISFQSSIPRLIECTKYLLEKEDQELFNYMEEIGAFDVIRIDRWFYCLYSDVLHVLALAKIWDKVIGGSHKILAFVAVVILTTFRRSLLLMKPGDPLVKDLSVINDETSEIISNKAIDLWKKHGSPLTVTDTKKEDPK